MDRGENIYITDIERNAGSTAGVLLFYKYTFNTASPAGVGSEDGTIIYRWTNADPIDNPVVAVDNNVTSFTDTTTTPNTVQKDPLATLVPDPDDAGHEVSEGLYVAWNTPATGSGDAILVVGSSNGGGNFTAPQLVNDSGYAGGDASPQIVFTQGSSNGQTPGGQLVFVWDNYGGDSIQVDSSQPGTSASNPIANSDDFSGTTGSFSDAAIRVNSATVVNGGSGYDVGDLLSVSDDANTEQLAGATAAQAQLQVATVEANASNLTLGSDGTGYKVGDILDLVGGGPSDTAATIKVTGVSAGAISTFTMTGAGQYAAPRAAHLV